jgi:hypothetical protein
MDDLKAIAAYIDYQAGLSLAQVAKAHCDCRKRLFAEFKRRGWRMRTVKRKPTVSFNGRTYSQNAEGYWRCTNDHGRLLHRDVWEFHNGPIPPGYHVHHKDEDKSHNGIANLECKPGSEHSKHHAAERGWNKPTPDKSCLYCGAKLVRQTRPNGRIESPSALAKRDFCNASCSRSHRKEAA